MKRATFFFLALIACGKDAPPPETPAPEPSLSPSQLVPEAIASASASAAPVTSAPPAPAQVEPSLFLLDPDKKASGKPGAVKVGCDDYLVPKSVKLSAAASDRRAQLEEALTKLFAEMKEKLTAKVTTVKEGESYAVAISGSLKFGGTCDVPRKVGQITSTAEQFGKVQYTLNGSASAWRCLGDESGKCK